MRRILILAAVIGLTPSLGFADEPKPKKALPLPGEVFTIDGHDAFVIPPARAKTDDKAAIKTPWVWYAPTLPGLPSAAEKWMFDRFTAAGIAIAGIDVGESYGSPEGRALYSRLHRELTEKRGFSSKPVLLARSRGGLMLLNWATEPENAGKVGGFAGIYPVCNLESYPGLKRAAPAYRLSEAELKAKLDEHNPVARLAPLAKAGVPFFSIHGDVDKVVPLEANSGAVDDRYRKLGGSMKLTIPKDQGHNMWPGFFQCQELVDFVLAHAR